MTPLRDSDNPNWKGDEAGYTSKHDWLYLRFGKPKECEGCGTTDEQTRYEWANISGKYKRVRSDWKRLCKKCHNKLDRIPQRAKARKGCVSQYKGVTWKPSRNRWIARIKVEGREYWLGSYTSEEAAATAYNNAALMFWGEDVFLNPV